MELEWLADSSSSSGDSYPFELTLQDDGALVVDTRPLVKALVGALCRNGPALIARRFHDTLAEIVTAVAARLRDATGIEDVVLTGGVFQNALLLETAKRKLQALGLRVHTHNRVPANDGGLALGQLAVAAAQPEHV
jgi:hydrogenase maturation protein HypF